MSFGTYRRKAAKITNRMNAVVTAAKVARIEEEGVELKKYDPPGKFLEQILQITATKLEE